MAAAPTDQEIALGLQAVWDTKAFKWEGFRRYSAEEVYDKFNKLPRKFADRSSFLVSESAGDKKKKKKKGRTATPTFDTKQTKLLRSKAAPAQALACYLLENSLTAIHVSTQYLYKMNR